jgi:hypothetical protein
MLENYRSVRGNSTPKIAKLIDLVQILMGQEFGERATSSGMIIAVVSAEPTLTLGV